MRRNILFIIDLFAAAFAPFFALAIRDGEVLSAAKLDSVVLLSAIAFFTAAAVFVVADVHRSVGRYVSLPDLGRVVAAASTVVLLSVVLLFAFNRLEGIPRSLPLIQWLCFVTLICGARVAARLWREWRSSVNANRPNPMAGHPEPVIVLGLNFLTELYLQAVKDLAPKRLQVVGILAKGEGLKGRLVQRHEVLGQFDDLGRKLAELEVHGIDVRRIVVTEPFEKLSEGVRAQLYEAELSRAITIDLFTERLGIEPPSPAMSAAAIAEAGAPRAEPPYLREKRIVDVVATLALTVALAPVLALVGLAVAIDVGLPLIFWQRRAGLGGRPFNLYKFRTMKASHDASGGRLPDSERVSRVGHFLRGTRLDELPQLYNVLVGDMSLIGPRPLLPQDLPKDARTRFTIRPGVTGWAQVNGGRDVSAEDKGALDAWYVAHLSPSVDFKIFRRTLRMLIWGEKMNWKAIRRALKHVNEASAVAKAETVPVPEGAAELTKPVEAAKATETLAPAPPPRANGSGAPRQRPREVSALPGKAASG